MMRSGGPPGSNHTVGNREGTQWLILIEKSGDVRASRRCRSMRQMFSCFVKRRVYGQTIRILVRRDEPLGKLPDGVVTGQEHDPAALQDRDIVALR
jgi:hypothetical protein